MFNRKNAIPRIIALLLSASFPVSAAAFSLASIPGASMFAGKSVTPRPAAVVEKPSPTAVAASVPPAVAASVSNAELPTVPVAARTSLVPPGRLADFRREARQARRRQALRDRIEILTDQKKIAELEASIKKLHVHTQSLSRQPMTRSAREDYVQQIVGFHHHWQALLTLNGRQYWVRPGSVTPAGTVFAIDESGVALQTGHGLLRVGMSTANAMPPMEPRGDADGKAPVNSLSALLSAFHPVIRMGPDQAGHPPSAPARSAGEH